MSDSQRLIEIILVVQLQTLHEISHRKNNFGALNRWTRCSFHKVVRNKSVFLIHVSLSYSLVRSLDLIFTMVRRRHVSPASSMTKLRKPTCKPIYSRKKMNKLFAGLGSVRVVKNCDLGLENAARGLYNIYIHKAKQQKHFYRIKREL